MLKKILLICLVSILAITAPSRSAQAGQPASRGLPAAPSETLGLSSESLSLIDEAVGRAIREGEMPGVVVLVARHGKIAYRKAFGNRALRPESEPMTMDTLFDMASLTKVMATTPAIMLLVQEGKVRLADRVRRYLPRFTGGGKEDITVRQLLVHFSGLRPDFDLARRWSGYEAALEELWLETTESRPGSEFKYSDLNFIALAEIVRSVTGKMLDVFVSERIYTPLGMSDTTFNPPPQWRTRIAPTESRTRSLAYLNGEATAEPSEAILRGEVHDPTAWRMGGVAGHAGLFSSAADVAIYAQMLLNNGTYGGKSLLSPLTVSAMTSPQSPRGASSIRGFGWDLDTAYSSPRGDLLREGYGHTGFTGTSLWINPGLNCFVVILSNRVHPDGKGDATHLRGVIANIVAAAILDR